MHECKTRQLKKKFCLWKIIEAIKRMVEPAKKIMFYDKVKLAKSFCYLADRLNAMDAMVENKEPVKQKQESV